MKDLILQNEYFYVALKLFAVVGVVATLGVVMLLVMELVVGRVEK